MGRRGGAELARVIDERTNRPCDYPALLREAGALADRERCSLPNACRRIAEAANYSQSDSIDRQLRRLRDDSRQPLAGYGVFLRDLGKYVKDLEDNLNALTENQVLSAHRVRQIRDRAECILKIGEDRQRFYDSAEAKESGSALATLLHGLGDIDPEMAPRTFLDGEKRQVELLIMIAGRVLKEAESTLDFLDPTRPRW